MALLTLMTPGKRRGVLLSYTEFCGYELQHRLVVSERALVSGMIEVLSSRLQ